MIKPYYQDDFCTIYHGDCRDILPHLEPVDLVLTDPPYGINIAKHGNIGKSKKYNPIINDNKTIKIKWVLAYGEKSIIWGGNYFADQLPPKSCWFVWDKRCGKARYTFADCELAWTNLTEPARIYTQRWLGGGSDKDAIDVRQHPTQKPVRLMRWCIAQINSVGTILDPYMGSGSTLIAAKSLGYKASGIEIEEKYCEIAAKRLSLATFMEQHPEVKSKKGFF